MEAFTTVLNLIVAGGPTAIIVILVIVVAYLIWEHFKMLKLIEKYQQILNDNRTQYTDSIIEIIDRYHNGNIELIQALNEIKVVLATLQKTIL